MTKFLPLTAIAALGLVACGAETYDAPVDGVTVTITSIEDSGTLYVALQDESIFGEANATYGATVEPSTVVDGTVDVFIPDVAAGTYAVAVFQDVNGNAQLDMGDNGVPGEPWALSYGAGTQGVPNFDDAKIEMDGKGDTVSITLN